MTTIPQMAPPHAPTLPTDYSDRLYNEDLAPLRPQTWT
ncbi:hypothetical protein BOO71_0002011 [Deinococcus marmoris]|uniref:Uncharacterized protein n=1 Tax=Deinococcus marmoris TaxID=249408 RepID=A0A1U7P3B1_9DEIO|nr:hypothetical protein BOO71_0002011 [Deinococcus marmoris]